MEIVNRKKQGPNTTLMFCIVARKVFGIKSLCKKCPYSEFFWSVFSRFWTETEIYRVSFYIQSECGKMLTAKTPNTDTFSAVYHFVESGIERKDFRINLTNFIKGSRVLLQKYFLLWDPSDGKISENSYYKCTNFDYRNKTE